MKKIIHISSDEKFVDLAIETFKKIENVDSLFFVKSKRKIRFIKNQNIRIFPNDKSILEAVNREQHVNFIVLHSLCLSPSIILKTKHPIIWNSWGFDIYSDIQDPVHKLLSMSLYKDQTRLILNTISKQTPLTSLLKKIKARIHWFKYAKAVKKISYISTVIPEEFEIIKNKIPGIQNFPFRYVSEQNEVIHITKKEAIQNRILLGNSRDASNNHLDILNALNSLQTELEVIIPFSYPNNKIYGDFVKQESKKFEFLKIMFLDGFMPYDEYTKIIDSCNVAILGHIRQQAVGNLFHLFGSGKKVFLYKDSVLYKHLKKRHYIIHSIDDDLSISELKKNLDNEQQLNNATLNKKNCQYDSLIKSLQLFFDKYH